MTSTLYFSRVTGQNLEGREFKLPADFEGELNVLLVAYERRQQDLLDTWTPHLRELSARFDSLNVYELPVLNFGLRMVRGWIDGGMRAGIPDKTARETTITLYTNVSAFNRSLGITSTRTTYVLLADRQGRVYWRGQGEFDATQFAGLTAAIQAAQSSQGRAERDLSARNR